MSIKLCNGYKISAMSVHQLMDWLEPFREQARAWAGQEYARCLLHRAAYYVDAKTLGQLQPTLRFKSRRGTDTTLETAKTSALFLAWQDAMTAHDDVRCGLRNPVWDFSCEVCILTARRKTLALLYAEQNHYEQLWIKRSSVVPYPYWDNTDRPEGLTAAQWERRGRTWREAIGSTWVPGQGGVTAGIVDNQHLGLPAEEKHAQLIPPLPERVASFARDKAFLAAKEADPEISDWRAFMTAEKTYQEHTAGFMTALPKELSWDDLTRKLGEEPACSGQAPG